VVGDRKFATALLKHLYGWHVNPASYYISIKRCVRIITFLFDFLGSMTLNPLWLCRDVERSESQVHPDQLRFLYRNLTKRRPEIGEPKPQVEDPTSLLDCEGLAARLVL